MDGKMQKILISTKDMSGNRWLVVKCRGRTFRKSFELLPNPKKSQRKEVPKCLKLTSTLYRTGSMMPPNTMLKNEINFFNKLRSDIIMRITLIIIFHSHVYQVLILKFLIFLL